MSFGGQEFLLLALLILLLFGASRLPRLAKSMREAREEFQKGSADNPKAEPPVQPQTPTPAPPVDNPPTE